MPAQALRALTSRNNFTATHYVSLTHGLLAVPCNSKRTSVPSGAVLSSTTPHRHLYAMATWERWSRGCGSGGIGTSGAINAYGDGVLEGNYVEQKAGKELHSTGRNVFNYGSQRREQSTQREDYNEYGKTGEALQYISQRQDRELFNVGQKPDILTRHGSFLSDPIDACTSLNSLTYGKKQVEEPSVQAYLWSGSNRHNRTVPLKTSTLDMTRKKVDQWKEDMDPYSAYKTTSRSAALAAANSAAQSPSKTGTIKPVTDSGQPTQIGRKPTGPAQQECEKNYRVVGLRDTYCTFLTTRKH